MWDLHPFSSPRDMSYFWILPENIGGSPIALIAPIAPQNAAQQLGLQWALDALALGLGIVFFQWPNGPMAGGKTRAASLRRPVWSMMDGTLKHFDSWFSTAQGPGTWNAPDRTSIEKGDARHDGKGSRRSCGIPSLSLRSGLGWRC